MTSQETHKFCYWLKKDKTQNGMNITLPHAAVLNKLRFYTLTLGGSKRDYKVRMNYFPANQIALITTNQRQARQYIKCL